MKTLKQKMASRKFWAAVVGVATAALVMTDLDVDKQQGIISLIGAFATLITYILSETHIDATRINNQYGEAEAQDKQTNEDI